MINTHPRRQKLKRLSNLEYSALDSDDLLTEILLRAPAKSVTRFRSVCKKWLCIISSDHFCHQHSLRHPKVQPSLLVRLGFREFLYLNPTTNGAKKMVPFRRSVPLRDCSIEQACNGLMLLKSSAGDISNQDRYSVYNPTTRRSRKIALSRKDGYPRFVGIGLAFDPSKSPYYKIVCIYCTNPNENPCLYALSNYEIEVYESESHSWKLVLEASSRKLCSGCIRRTHWNNKIYWMSYGGYYCYFDIDKNEMKSLSFPPHPYGEMCFPLLEESNGHLYHYVVISGESAAVFVWELVGNGNDDGASPSSWLFKYRASIMDGLTKILRFMAGDGDGDGDGDETCSLLTHKGRKMRVYSFGDETNEDFLDFTTQPCSQPGGGCFSVTLFHFGETLALV